MQVKENQKETTGEATSENAPQYYLGLTHLVGFLNEPQSCGSLGVGIRVWGLGLTV